MCVCVGGDALSRILITLCHWVRDVEGGTLVLNGGRLERKSCQISNRDATMVD